jgi:hypothetical protein
MPALKVAPKNLINRAVFAKKNPNPLKIAGAQYGDEISAKELRIRYTVNHNNTAGDMYELKLKDGSLVKMFVGESSFTCKMLQNGKWQKLQSISRIKPDEVSDRLAGFLKLFANM